ncbi:MAG: GNAT family N-acetyltransferase [Candidatus Methanomethylophilaceae archaeon]|jgi:predicted GNAT family acetyltransferase
MTARIEHDAESLAFRLYYENEEGGRLTYRKDGERLTVLQVSVIPSLRGKGLAKELTEAFRIYAEKEGREYSSLCSYAKSALGR